MRRRLLTLATIASVTALFGAMLLGHVLVQTIVGPAYASAAVNLSALMLTLIMLGVSSVTVVLAIVYERPGIALRASTVRLVTFCIVDPLCAARWGSFGACIAIVAASSAHAILSTLGLRDALGSSIRSAAAAAGAAVVFLPIVWLRSSPLVNLICLAVRRAIRNGSARVLV